MASRIYINFLLFRSLKVVDFPAGCLEKGDLCRWILPPAGDLARGAQFSRKFTFSIKSDIRPNISCWASLSWILRHIWIEANNTFWDQVSISRIIGGECIFFRADNAT